MTDRERYEEYLQAKRDIEEIPFTFEDWLEIDQREEEPNHDTTNQTIYA